MVTIVDINGNEINNQTDEDASEDDSLLNQIIKNKIRSLVKKDDPLAELSLNPYCSFNPHYLMGLSIDDLGRATGIDELNGVGIEFIQAIIYNADMFLWEHVSTFLCRAHYVNGLKGLLEGEFEEKTASCEFKFDTQEILHEYAEDLKTWKSVLDMNKCIFAQDLLLRGVSDKDDKIVDACCVQLEMFIKSPFFVDLHVTVTPVKNKYSVGDIKAGTYSFLKNSVLMRGPEQPYGRARFGSHGFALGASGFFIEKLEDFPENEKKNFPDSWK